MRKKVWSKAIFIIAIAAIVAVVDLPNEQKSFLRNVPFIGNQLADLRVNLGLDLQGGTHLDYKVITKDIAQQDVDKVVEGVKEVIERRVNKLGVAEPNIFDSQVGNERHIIVELAGIKDIEKAKEIVGKTIQLEFKERQTEVDPEAKSKMKSKANDFLALAVASPKNFEESFSDFEKKPEITLKEDEEWVWNSDLPVNLQLIAELQPGEVYSSLISDEVPQVIPTGDPDRPYDLKMYEGFYVAQLIEKGEAERTIETQEERKASHILIAFAGAEGVDEEITRTEEEARKLAEEVLEKASLSDADFTLLAEEFSDGPTASEGGNLGFFERGRMVPEFDNAIFGQDDEKVDIGLISEVVRTKFGFHVIRLEEIKAATSETKTEARVKLAKAFFDASPSGWAATGLTGQHFRRADVGSDPTTMRPIVNIYFTQTAITKNVANWWQLVWYLLALTGGISLFSSMLGVFFSEGRKVNEHREKIIMVLSLVVLIGAIYGIVRTQPAEVKETEEPKIESVEDLAETDKAGVDLFAEITKRNLHKPLAIFLDGLPIIDTNGDGEIDESDSAYAPTIQSEILTGQAVISGLSSYEEANELVQNLNTGAIPAPVKLVGQFTIGATLGHSALATSLKAGMIGLIAVMIFMILFYRLPGVVASLALVVYGVLLTFALQIFGVVFTLAGVAGVILSIGMAVDANILIFERMKEELALGKTLSHAVEDGFARAWTSIRDSNVSSLITCAILFWFGSSIIQGFALTLAVGILISMFSAITVSRNFLRVAVGLVKNRWFYRAKK